MKNSSAIARRLPSLTLEFEPIEGLEGLDFIQAIVPGSEAVEVWRAARDAVSETGRWPIIVGGVDAVDKLREHIVEISEHLRSMSEKNESLNDFVQSFLRDAKAYPFEQWLADRRDPVWMANDLLEQAEHLEILGSSLADSFRKRAETLKERGAVPFDPEPIKWPDPEEGAVTGFCVLNDPSKWEDDFNADSGVSHSRTLVEEAALVFLPTASGWEAPAYLFFGGFNACPTPDIHVSMAKWGNQHYGAELVAMNRERIEFEPRRDPQTREAACQLARDLSHFSEEVNDLSSDLGRLASALKNGSVWCCWWD